MLVTEPKDVSVGTSRKQKCWPTTGSMHLVGHEVYSGCACNDYQALGECAK